MECILSLKSLPVVFFSYQILNWLASKRLCLKAWRQEIMLSKRFRVRSTWRMFTSWWRIQTKQRPIKMWVLLPTFHASYIYCVSFNWRSGVFAFGLWNNSLNSYWGRHWLEVILQWCSDNVVYTSKDKGYSYRMQ